MTGNNLPPGLDHTHPNLAGCDDYYDTPEESLSEDESLPAGRVLCSACGGGGEHETGERESDTDAVTVLCPECKGQGFIREGGKNGN